jgi:hypothetical protein
MRLGEAVRHLACVVAITAAVAFLFSDLFSPVAFWTHEKLYVYIRADQVAKELEAGHYPQAFPDAIWGAGYAFPRFYPPLTVWLAAGLTLLFEDVVAGTNAAFLLSVLASGFAMYFMVAALARSKSIALAAALIYVSVPYRFVDVFVRGALAEAWTFVWYPIVVAGLWRAITRRVFPWYLPVGIAGLVLTHNITAVYFLGFCALVCTVGFYWNGWRAAVLPALGLALGLALSAWFLLPQQAYMQDVWVGDREYMWADLAHVASHRVLPHQFLFSYPDWWYGESRGPQELDLMSFELGPAQLLVVPLAAAFLLLLARRQRRLDHLALVLALTCFAGWAGCLGFMLWPEVFLIVLPPQFGYIQFPWRLLGLSLFLSATAAALLVRYGGFSDTVRNGFVAAAILFVVLVPPFQREAAFEDGWAEDRVLASEYVREEGYLGYTVGGEYLPRDFDVHGIREGRVGPEAFERPRVADGEGAVTAWHRSGLDMEATVSGAGDRSLVLPLAFYDFYVAKSETGLRLETFSTGGMLGVRVPAGVGEVAIRQEITPITVVGIWISGAALVATALCSLLVGWRERSWAWLPAGRRPVREPERSLAPQPLDAEQEV